MRRRAPRTPTATVLVRAVLVAAGAAAVARGLMRLVAWDTLGQGSFSVAGTLGIVLLFVLSGVGAALAGLLTRRRWVVAVVVLLTSALLWEADLAIGLSSFDDARARPMTGARWVGFWALFAAISSLALATPYAGLRLGRAARVTEATP